jgi:serine/threonine-protein kinase
MPDDDNVPTDPIAATVVDRSIGTAATTTPSPITGQNAGQLPARYRLAGSLGAGGMGEVLLARDTQIDRDVAIKRMLIEPSGPAVARFLREAKVQGRLDHPAIVPVYELAHDGAGRPFFVMKRLAGTTLADVIAKQDPRYPRQKLLRAFADACLAIELAHSRDVIHRDLKPANIMLGDFGEVYVLDWGIARVEGETDPVESPGVTTGQLTQAGAILGTPGYIAPELVRGEPIDRSADVFGLGCILFEILAGQPLLRGGGVAAVLGEPDARPSVRAPDRDIAPELDAACVAATAPDRAARPSARALAEMIERFLDGDRDLVQRKRLATTHLEAARTALAAGDGETERALAMREAGRALALDPTSGAAELLGRLMLEPPKQIPTEVEQRLRAFDDHAGRTKARLFMPSYIIGIFALPLLLLVGMDPVVGTITYGGALLVNITATWLVIRKVEPTTARDMYLAASANAVLIAVASVLFGPVLIAPLIAIISMVMFGSDPRLRLDKLAALTITPVIVPWALALFGVLGTIDEVGGDLMLHSRYLYLAIPTGPITWGMFVIFVIAIGGFATRRVATNERSARREVELQAWHLRQLVGS